MVAYTLVYKRCKLRGKSLGIIAAAVYFIFPSCHQAKTKCDQSMTMTIIITRDKFSDRLQSIYILISKMYVYLLLLKLQRSI